ncbi:RING/U-box superfamily protein [Rhynchospora pubera]|uniref:RBR-type E3 ubiquitin transferase n=1 Tax=Rhynchospora pubera TaxID=906938 RepID=A0AAV8F3W4_9POAL|nr:RING/U-box superfamily protein [Rhynchospora pubera]
MNFDLSLMASDGNRSGSCNSVQIALYEMSRPLAIKRDHLMAAQMVDLSRVMEFLAIKESHARVLLMHHRWNVERIFDALERKGMESLFVESGVPFVEDEAVGYVNQSPMQSEGDKFLLCTMCFEEVGAVKVTRMDCGHYFCNSCWAKHFITRINNGDARKIRCMAIHCNSICDYKTVCLLVSAQDPLVSARFDRLIMESYIDDNDQACWCPSNPPCGHAIRVGLPSDPYCEVECVCGTQFCFNCLSKAHSPCTCHIWDMWVKRCEVQGQNIGWIEINTNVEVERQSISWIAENAKVCPGCGNAVVKADGCNHMTCRCGQTFCWLCGGPTGKSAGMAVHSCNRFTKAKQKSVVELKGTTSQDFCRYMHYYERYRSHNDSLGMDALLQRRLQNKRGLLSLSLSAQPTDRLNGDENWLLSGVQKLLLSRRVLTYTYPFAFYMFGDELAGNNLQNKDIRQNLFEIQQQQLELCVEKLAMELLRDFDKVSPGEVADIRLRVISLSRLLDQCCRKMYQCIEEELLPYLSPTAFIAQYKASGPDKATEISCVVRS